MERIIDFIGLNNILRRKKNSQKVIILDSNTYDNCLATLIGEVESLCDAQIIEIDPGEENKSLETYTTIIQTLIEQGSDKNTQLIALGGGMITDLALFIGATYKRGIDTYLVPTTLLAMIDATIGGKCAINFGEVKNQIGTFVKKITICLEPVFLETLSERQILNGLAEILKIAMVSDANLFETILQNDPLRIVNNEEIIHNAIKLKQTIVKQDPFDKNYRHILNFGHTIGHALESMAMKKGEDLLHGEAVASGVYYTLDLCNNLSKETTNKIKQYIAQYYTIQQIDNVQELFNYMNSDKKTINNEYNFVLLEEIGKATINNKISREQIETIIKIKQR
jgi:3-dehydroquinate synthase